jgi:flagellar export protein FliJ
MATFRFRLESALKLRQEKRDLRRQELARAYEAEKILDHERQTLRQQRLKLKLHVQQRLQPGAVNVQVLLTAQQYNLLLQSEQQSLDSRAQQLQEEIERRRTALREADSEVQMLEKLEQRQRQQHRRRQSKREVQTLDDTAISRQNNLTMDLR